ncbi:MAG TPA: PLP-dependent aminotransferase family protein [Roseomonas sp.]|jgi:GntR family transcriptional regulator/MocR family aminotransferase
MAARIRIALDRGAKAPLTAQIHAAVAGAIRDGRLAAGARLPSWRDLAAQLGVARGTVRAAYERLIDEQLVIAAGAAGTHVAARPTAPAAAMRQAEAPPLPELFPDFGAAPLPFQMGVPAQDAFPATLWSRIMARQARAAAAAPVSYPDPRGQPALRREIAAYLAIARGIACTPGQVMVTAGFAGALNLAIRTLRLEGRTAWQEEPGFPLTRIALGLAGVAAAAVPVDGEGLDVAAGIRIAPQAAVAIVTPGQQAPLGVTMTLGRRMALLAWARESGGWIIEDDYLGELQVHGRAAPALLSLDRDGRVLHAGSFSKTISPALRLGFLVVPPALAARAGEIAVTLAPAPAPATQGAVTEFMAEGHFLRHLRRMKRLYAGRRAMLVEALRAAGGTAAASGSLSVRLDLPDGAPDTEIAIRALPFGLAPVPLSPWHAEAPRRHGLLLGVTNLAERRLAADCARLMSLVRSA